MKTYAIRLTLEEGKRLANRLQDLQLPHDEMLQSVLRKVQAANAVVASLRDDGEDEGGGGSGNGNGGGGELHHAMRDLSRREQLVLQCVMLGESNKMIARKLVLTESTVKVHMKAVLRKLRLENRTQAAMWAHTNLNGRVTHGTAAATANGDDVSAAHRSEA